MHIASYMVRLLCPPGLKSQPTPLTSNQAFLRVSEQTPDANRGMDIPAAIVSYREPQLLVSMHLVKTISGGNNRSSLSSPLLEHLLSCNTLNQQVVLF